MSKYKLTEERKKNLLKYYELIRSNDEESILLGIQLFYNEFKDFKCPVKKQISNKVVYYDFCELREPIFMIDSYHIFNIYWIERIIDLNTCGYYINNNSSSAMGV